MTSAIRTEGLSKDYGAGRGLFDLDFDANGQMVWKLSRDAGRAQLAETAGRSG